MDGIENQWKMMNGHKELPTIDSVRRIQKILFEAEEWSEWSHALRRLSVVRDETLNQYISFYC
jgi:hypothetical protein